MASEDSRESSSNALLYCFVAAVLAISLVGFFRGVNVTKKEMQSHLALSDAPEPAHDDDVPLARSYSEMRLKPPGEGSGWEQSLQAARAPRKGKVTAEDMQQALARRAKARAYDGAPPTIPHPVRQNSAAECMACHGQDFKFGQAAAQALPHASFTSCTQCHVPEEAPMPGGEALSKDPRAVENRFQGTRSTPHGPRAWNIAPPQTPHTTFMRENCMSCHGDAGPAPMRTSHPSRQSCTQCHASSAALDLRPGPAGSMGVP